MRKTCLLFLLLFLHAAFFWSQNPVTCMTNQAPGAGSCADACLHCFLDGRTGQTSGYAANPAPGFCGAVENNQWFGFVAGFFSITIEAIPSNCQSGDGVEIALYQNCSDAPIACAIGKSGDGNVTRTLTAPLDLGKTYFLMVDGYDGDQCAFQLKTSPPAAIKTPPVNPSGPIQGPAVVAPFSTLKYLIPPVPDATAYRWTGPPDSKINGQYPPVTLPAPSGNQVSVTFSNQEGPLCVTPVDLCSVGSSCLNITIGQNELAAPCPAGNYPAADLCADACVFCNFNGYTGTTAGYTAQIPPGFCSTAQNDQWLAFVAGGTSGTFTCTPSNCANGDGIQLALYASCNAAGPIACSGGQQGGGNIPVSVSVNTLVPGATYYLVIDGYVGDICDFQLSVSPPSAAVAIPVGPTGPINGPSAVCPGGTFNYSVEPVSGAGAYTWAGPPGSTINGRPSPVTLNGAGGNVAQITFGEQPGAVCVQPANACFTGTQVCKQVTLAPIPVTNLSPVTICAEDAPYYTPWGHECPTPGSYCTTLTSSQGCDSVVCIQVNIRAPITFIHAPKFLCAGDSVVICGEAFRDVGNHVKICESYLGCDSTVYQTIVGILNPQANILPIQNLLCADLPVVLNSAPSPGTKTWSTLSGQVLDAGNSITVTAPDTYVLTTVATAGVSTCVASDTIRVESGKPEVAVSGGTLTCSQPAVQLDATLSPAGLQLSWIGPDGFTSDLEDPVVTQPGMYVLTATDVATGCTAQASTDVTGDFAVPVISLPSPTLNCATPALALNCPFMPSAAECLWTGPGIATPTPDLVVSQPGIYLLTVTNLNNGCTATSELTVTADFQIPVITAYADTVTCLNPAVTIHCETDIPMSVCDWSGVGPEFIVTATAPNGCTATAAVTVPVDTDAPALDVADDTLRCDQPVVTLFADTNVPNALFVWTGPGGFASSVQNPTVVQPGQYFVEVTNPVNGCTTSATATVYIDQGTPQVLISPPDKLTCAKTAVTLFLTANMPGLTYLWEGPNGFSSTQSGPEVTEPGMYTLLATNPVTGCSSVTVVEVQQDVQSPEVSVQQVIGDQNGQGLGAISISVMHNGLYAVAWYHNGLVVFNTENISGLTVGDYTVVVTGSNGCTDTLVVTVPESVSAPELAEDMQWIIFPNPTNSLLFLRYTGLGHPEAQVQVLDATGRLVLEQAAEPALPEIVVACGHLSPGMYTVLIRTKTGVLRHLVAVQR
jgi:hypothetical protein